ncbi:hypothetical protein SY83_06960 [Paenibacillus swuensis]|uniref:Peptidase S8/S53 domain-containing protein n=1 Tax=Paenibacillus swuensis TaxID=1178515 RepID=A0A172TP65_9BACL|nr:hypothetical protein SY83_06960 [Paenibacillus swuensis]
MVPFANEVPLGIYQIDAPDYWNIGYFGFGSVIAVLDTGCDVNHPDLQGRIIGTLNFTTEGNSQTDVRDFNGHGTHVAGTIAANLNGIGVAGAAPATRLLIIKVLDGQGNGNSDVLTYAINIAVGWTGPNGERVRVINMSLGSPVNYPPLQNAIINAKGSGVLLVAAAGNNGDGNANTNEIAYPGYYPEVLEVGAYDPNTGVATFSNSNPQMDLIAPGVNVLSTFPGGSYAYISGTSMAAPHVSGGAAILIGVLEAGLGRAVTEPELYSELKRRTVSLGLSPNAQGNGLLRLFR